MRLLFLFITSIFFVASIGCRGFKTNVNKKNITNNKTSINKGNLYELKNRIPNCDSALVFMDNVIIPVEAKPHSKSNLLVPERTVKMRIVGEGKDFWKTDKYNFYVNAECLIGLSSSKVFEMFSVQDSIPAFMEVDRKFQEQEKPYYLLVVSLNDFLMTINIKDGKVYNASAYDGISETN